jgi:hypothetical protein
MCTSAQNTQAMRQPWPSSISAVMGQPIVLAKPAISVMPVIAWRDRSR